jgi:hypothetical protein
MLKDARLLAANQLNISAADVRIEAVNDDVLSHVFAGQTFWLCNDGMLPPRWVTIVGSGYEVRVFRLLGRATYRVDFSRIANETTALKLVAKLVELDDPLAELLISQDAFDRAVGGLLGSNKPKIAPPRVTRTAGGYMVEGAVLANGQLRNYRVVMAADRIQAEASPAVEVHPSLTIE